MLYRKRVVVLSLASIILLILALLILSKIIRPNLLIVDKFDVCGIDVSNYQGDIDWNKIESQGIDFAYIKATEGSSFVDKSFSDNWKNASETDVYIGAYHFFSFESAGRTQADNYINTVGDLEGKLIPVVDVEYYGNIKKQDIDINAIKEELLNLLSILESEYNKKPVIYTTYKAYHDFVQGSFDEYDLWIRNVYYTPDIDMKGKWTYWQYTDKAEFDAYSGEEKYIDMNVYVGSMEDFLSYNHLKKSENK